MYPENESHVATSKLGCEYWLNMQIRKLLFGN